MKYVATCRFRDLQDKGRIYEKGDTYPRRGLKKDEARIKELSGSNNKAKKPLIKAVE